MCDTPCLTINDKYLLFLGIEPKLRRGARICAGGDSYAAREILASAADLFVRRYRDSSAGEGGAVALARLCLGEAARNLRLYSRPEPTKDAGGTDWGGPVVPSPPPPSTLPLPAAWELWDRLPRAAQVGEIAAVIRQVLAGADLADAGAAVGWSAVQTTRKLARLGQGIALWEHLSRNTQPAVIVDVIRMCLQGADLAEAGAAVGWSAEKTAKEFAGLRERITGTRPARYTSRRPVRLAVPDAA